MNRRDMYELRQFRIRCGTHKKLKVIAALKEEHIGDILHRLVDAEMTRVFENNLAVYGIAKH